MRKVWESEFFGFAVGVLLVLALFGCLALSVAGCAAQPFIPFRVPPPDLTRQPILIPILTQPLPRPTSPWATITPPGQAPTATPPADPRAAVGSVYLVLGINEPDLVTLIKTTAKGAQCLAHNREAAIQGAMWANGHIFLGNEADVFSLGVWQGVSQLATDPVTGAEFAYFATNRGPDGQWSVVWHPMQ